MFVYTPQNVCLLLLRIFGHKLPSLICLSTSDINKILQSHNKSILTLNFFLTNQLILTLRAKAFAQYPVSGQLFSGRRSVGFSSHFMSNVDLAALFNLTATSDLVGLLTQLVIIEVVGSLTRAESA